jgi:phosphatidylinositol alpha-mannosyltransferase
MSVAAPCPRLSWRREVILFLAAYVAYSVGRGAADGSLEAGLENARSIVALQARLGIGVEAAVQEHLIGQPVMWLLNRLYLIAQFAVVPVALVWVYRRRRDLYPKLRTTVLATWLLALPVYALFPTAPPRLADIGVVDTVSEQTRFALDSPLVTAFYNPIAAVPSLHAGFAIAVGVAVAASVRALWARVAALLWGPAVAVVVIATGNHFVLDVVLGAVAVVVGYSVALLVHRESRTTTRVRARALAAAAGAPLRVALLCPYDWNRPGGVRTHVAGLAEALRDRGHHVDVIAAGRPGVGAAPGVRRVGATTPFRINGSVARIAIGPGATWRVWRAIASGRYDVVHLHEPIIPMVCWSALWLRRSALIATFHAYSPPERRPYRIAAPLFGRLVRRVPTPIAVSEAARSCAAHVTDRLVTLIPNGVAPPAAPGGAHLRDGRRILFVGRNEPRKGLAVLVTALARLPDHVVLDVVGVSPDELDGDIPETCRARMRIHGRPDDEALRRLLRDADVLCAPSLGGESFGLVLAEAMAHGVPVVASDITGYRDVLAPGCGILVPPGDATHLAQALRAVLADERLRVRLANRACEAAAPLHWTRVSVRVEEAYRRAVLDHAASVAGADPRPAHASAGVAGT